WAPLESNADYVLVVDGNGIRSDSKGNIGLGFWLLPEEESQSVNALESNLRALELSDSAADLLVVELYISNQLYTEAVQLLEKLVLKVDAPTVWLTLGRVYLELGLTSEAKESLDQAFSMAQASGQLEIEAHAQLGLGLALRFSGDDQASEEHLLAARDIFEEIGDQKGLEQVAELLSQ
ncbi:MAG: tetratricopeptide repeat protein, partial [Anaerolineaceae bacterium]|nr:tetratricopeptide repeat protein [Anaerolineaceae bacterium]